MSLADVVIPQPHLVPGYGGYIPQFKYRMGKTFGTKTHKILIDPTVNKSEKLIVSDRTTDEYQVVRPPQTAIDLVEGRRTIGDAVYRHPTIPGYEGFIPRLRSQLGQRFSVSATEALSEFELQQMRDRQALNLLRHHVSLQEGFHMPRSLQDRQTVKTQFRMPLSVVRPEMAGVVRTVAVTEPYLAPPSHGTSPYFLHCSHPDKFFIPGYAGHVPFARGRFGEGQSRKSRAALDDFTASQRRRRSTEWAPVSVARPDPPVVLRPETIYSRRVGLPPGYQGHIPGALFRHGQTFGNDTIDAKRWLRGDFT